MRTIIKSQENLNRLIEHTPMIGNIYYDVEMNYSSIDWESEYILIIDVNNKFTVERIMIN